MGYGYGRMTYDRNVAGADLPAGARGAASRHGRLAGVLLAALAALAFGQLVALAIERAGDPGYDFRYYWLAGRLWLEGVSPYGPGFREAAGRLIEEGNRPEIWANPPTYWLPSVLLAAFDLGSAWRLWLALSLCALVLASASVAFALSQTSCPGSARAGAGLGAGPVFCLHLAVMAIMEVTQIALFVGQSSVFVYLGAALLIAGLARERRAIGVIGLVLLCAKPQVGVLVALALLLGGGARTIVLPAIAVSLLILLPALPSDPLVVLEWLAALASYDGASYANQPFAMSGIRHVLWAYSGHDIGNLAAMIVTLAAGTAIAVRARMQPQVGARGAASKGRALADLVAVEILIALSLAPLHLYDFVVIGVGMTALAATRGASALAGIAALALCLRPSDLHIALLSGDFVPLFPGTVLATFGAAVMLLAAAVAARSVPGPGADEATPRA